MKTINAPGLEISHQNEKHLIEQVLGDSSLSAEEAKQLLKASILQMDLASYSRVLEVLEAMMQHHRSVLSQVKAFQTSNLQTLEIQKYILAFTNLKELCTQWWKIRNADVNLATGVQPHIRSECSKCNYFRTRRPPSELFGRDFDTTRHEVVQALIKIADDEYRLEALEAQQKIVAARTGKWPSRPIMSAYCGAQEEHFEYFVSETKNRDNKCSDFKQSEIVQHTCSTCKYQQIGYGHAHDAQLIERALTIANDAALGWNWDPNGKPDQFMSTLNMGVDAARKIENAVGPQLAMEIEQAYQGKGIMLRTPKYLSWCKKFSKDGHYVIGIMHNQHCTCKEWSQLD